MPLLAKTRFEAEKVEKVELRRRREEAYRKNEAAR